jgi:hypothetical protein
MQIPFLSSDWLFQVAIADIALLEWAREQWKRTLYRLSLIGVRQNVSSVPDPMQGQCRAPRVDTLSNRTTASGRARCAYLIDRPARVKY